MKIIFTVIITLLSSIVCVSQVDTTSVPFVSYWSTGDSYDYQVTKIKKQWAEGELTKNDSSSYIANFEVMDSTDTNYKIKWSYKTDLYQFNIPAKIMEKFSKYELTEVIYLTSEVGEFMEIENWEEISKMMKGLFTDLIDVLAEEDVENEANKVDFEKAMQPFIDLYESKQGIEQLVFKELQLFHFPFGLEYSANEPILYEEQLPNMLGGRKPIRGDAKLYFDDIDFESAHCVMIQEMKLNPEDTKEMISTLFAKMKLNNKELNRALKTAHLDIVDFNRYEYFYYPGVPVMIETKRETLIDIDKEKVKGIDITRIELLD